MITRLSHVHHAVSNMQDTLKLYDDLWGLKPSKIVRFPEEGVTNALFRIGQNYIIVQEPSHPQAALAKHIERRGEGLRSICLISDNLDAEISALKARGVEFVERIPTPASPFRAAWVNPRYTKGLLIMLAQDPEIADFMQKSY